jgi:hypothetical protein
MPDRDSPLVNWHTENNIQEPRAELGPALPAAPLTEPFCFDFSQAVRHIRAGKAVTRMGWNGRYMWLRLQSPDAYSLMSRPYIYMRTVDGDLVPWVASQSDLLADDWALCRGER